MDLQPPVAIGIGVLCMLAGAAHSVILGCRQPLYYGGVYLIFYSFGFDLYSHSRFPIGSRPLWCFVVNMGLFGLGALLVLLDPATRHNYQDSSHFSYRRLTNWALGIVVSVILGFLIGAPGDHF